VATYFWREDFELVGQDASHLDDNKSASRRERERGSALVGKGSSFGERDDREALTLHAHRASDEV
jgi:hypothetical protein